MRLPSRVVATARDVPDHSHIRLRSRSSMLVILFEGAVRSLTPFAQCSRKFRKFLDDVRGFAPQCLKGTREAAYFLISFTASPLQSIQSIQTTISFSSKRTSSQMPSTSVPATATTTAPTRDWESVFQQLQSSYGFAGTVPSIPFTTSKVPKPSSKQSSRAASPARGRKEKKMPEGHEGVFGGLFSTYGLAGARSPSIPSRPASERKLSMQV